jgi:hypothetical protein
MNGRFVQATRLMNGVTARVEKRVLIWMAERMPAWIHSDHLTSLAAIAMVGASVSYAAARSWPPALLLVNVCLAINWFGDSLDGTLARVRNQQRPRFGFYVDHVIDCGGIALLLLGMAASGLMSLPLALGVLPGVARGVSGHVLPGDLQDVVSGIRTDGVAAAAGGGQRHRLLSPDSDALRTGLAGVRRRSHRRDPAARHRVSDWSGSERAGVVCGGAETISTIFPMC